MDSLFAIYPLQPAASPASEAGGGLHHHRIARGHAMEKSSGSSFYPVDLAMRVYLHAVYLVSVDQSS